MALRVRKSFKLAPGIRMNVSGGGMSWTLGPRGASVGIGKRGTFLNAGIPGTGLSSRVRLDGGDRQRTSHRQEIVTVAINVEVSDDGTVEYRDGSGALVSDRLIAEAKKQQGDVIRSLLQKKCDDINEQIAALSKFHHETPSPDAGVIQSPQQFVGAKPVEPTPKPIPFLGKFLKGPRLKVERQNLERELAYKGELSAWRAAKAEHEKVQVAIEALFSEAKKGDHAAMESWLEHCLQGIVWPQETNIGITFSDDSQQAILDVDLPEIEDFPKKIAVLAARGFQLEVKDMGSTQARKLYMQHVHAIGFRLAGEIFANLPRVQSLVLSGYSQRHSKASGDLTDEYLYSFRCRRSEWMDINLSQPQAIDPVTAFERFELKRDMTATGIFKPIMPLSP